VHLEPGDLFFGWSWVAAVGVIVLMGLCLLPAIFFLLNLQNLLNRVSPANQGMSPGLVWLNFIPIFNLGWFVYTVIKVRDSVSAEFRSRGWSIDGDLGYNVGLAAAILWIASVFVGWIPFIGWVLPLGALICWIVYWLKTSDLRERLEPIPAWRRPMGYPPTYPSTYPPAYPPTTSPYAPQYPQPYGGPPTSEAAAAGVTAADGPGAVAAATIAAAEAAPSAAEEQDTLCGACGSKIDAGDKFCRSCGLPLP
jgi:hypothetical protein